jgi:hypothetical protein
MNRRVASFSIPPPADIADLLIYQRLSSIRVDVQALTAVGLLNPTDGGLRAARDVLETKIAI